MIPTAALSSIAFCAPFLLVIACALLLIIEERRERKLHDALSDRPRLGLHTSSTRTLSGAAVPPPRTAERPSTDKKEAAALERPAS